MFTTFHLPQHPDGTVNFEQLLREFRTSGNKHLLGINDTMMELFAQHCVDVVEGIEGMAYCIMDDHVVVHRARMVPDSERIDVP